MWLVVNHKDDGFLITAISDLINSPYHPTPFTMKLDVKNCGNLRLVGFSINTSNATATEDIPALWQKLNRARANGRFPQDISTKAYAFYNDYKLNTGDAYTYFVGFAMEQPTISVLLDDEIETAYIPMSNYAVYKLEGFFPDQMLSFWHWVWRDENLKRPMRHDLEVYDNGCNPYAHTEMEVWLNLNNRVHNPSPEKLAELPSGVQPLGQLINQVLIAA